jgi:hypothetical protein
MTPAIGVTAVIVIFLVFFRDPPRKSQAELIAARKGENLETP